MKNDLEKLELDSLSAPAAARRLLGCELWQSVGNNIVKVRLVETESYDQTDAASHSYKGKTPRTDVMFGPAGMLYVYFTYGMHYCCNIVVGAKGYGAAVLIRAVEPIEGEEMLRKRRDKPDIEITNGPAKLCQALAIDRTMNGHDLSKEPLKLIFSGPTLADDKVITTKRIGISRAKDKPWRFYLKDNKYVSRQ